MILPCIVCKKKLEEVGEPSENQPYEGTTFMSHGHYGSTVFDPMDGTYLEINICDDCLREAGKSEQVAFGRNMKPVVVPSRYSQRSNVGWYYMPYRPLVHWNPDTDAREEDDLLIESIEELIGLRERGYKIESRFTDDQLKEMLKKGEP